MGRGFPAQGGLFPEEAVELLREFYAAGNPAGTDAPVAVLGSPHCAGGGVSHALR